jgi:hypothetical protein
MLLYFVFGVLAAVGALFLVWLLMGFMFPGSKECTVAIRCQPDRELALLRRFRWLRELESLRCEIIFLDSQSTPESRQQMLAYYPYLQFCTGEAWLEKQKERA